jgi:NAD(P)-dependent dehydrogenase (short-subunit alcohol dehydrogenase family)
MDVNVTGPLRCTQAFLPLLRAGQRRGRVVNMSSIVGGGWG